MKNYILKLSVCLFFIAFIGAIKGICQTPKTIENILKAQEDAWNNGDIAMYMDAYWKSDSLKFIGKNGVQYGWKKTLENYQKSYPDKATMGTLHFDIVSIEILNESNAFVIGKWNIKRNIGDIGGYFTLLFQKKNGKWKIVSDHTS